MVTGCIPALSMLTQYSSIESHNMVLAFRCTYVILQSIVKMAHFVINNNVNESNFYEIFKLLINLLIN